MSVNLFPSPPTPSNSFFATFQLKRASSHEVHVSAVLVASAMYATALFSIFSMTWVPRWWIECTWLGVCGAGNTWRAIVCIISETSHSQRDSTHTVGHRDLKRNKLPLRTFLGADGSPGRANNSLFWAAPGVFERDGLPFGGPFGHLKKSC